MRLNFYIKQAIASALFWFLAWPQLFAQQQGAVDTTFNPGDHGFDYGQGTEDSHWPSKMVQAIGIQSDGKIILGGGFDFYNGAQVNGIVRTFPDGRIDTSFKSSNGFPGFVTDIEIDSNDNIYIVGGFNSYNGYPTKSIIKLNPDGSVDSSFQVTIGKGPTNSSLSAIALQNDGKIVVAGAFTSFDNIPKGRLVRLHQDGSLDTNYISGVGANDFIRNLVIQPDGKCIVVGDFVSFNGVSSPRIARINLDGTLDSNFSTNVGLGFTSSSFTASTTGVDVQANGRIIVVGSFLSFNNTTANNMVRLFASGTRDMSFNPTSVGWMRTVEVLPNQFFVVTGSPSFVDGHPSNGIFRFMANGAIDVNYSVDDLEGDIRVTKTQPNNRTFIGGLASRFDINRNIYRLRPNGSLDTTFNLITGFDGGINRILELKDGDLVISGLFSEYNKQERKNIVKIQPNGSVDTLFMGGPNSTTFALAEHDNGKILVGGAYGTYNGQTSRWLTRVLPNGNIDYSFINATGQFSSVPYEIIVQPDLKIIVAGSDGTSSSLTYKPLYRLNYNGSFDASFANTNFVGSVFAIELQPDGKILAGGAFTNYNNTGKNRLIRLLHNGTLDNSFAVGTGANDIVRDIKIQYDGRVLVCGYFSAFNGQTAGRIIRLLNDGQIDSSFNIGSGADSTIFSISLQTDEKIILTGAFSSFNGYPCNNVVRLNNNGSVDSSFFVGTGANDYVRTSTVLKNGDILIGGGFTAYQGIGRNRIARLTGDSCLVIRKTDTIRACDSYTWIDGITYSKSVFGPNIVYPSSSGCDSVFFLYLQIDTLVATASLNGFTLNASSNGDTYQWINCSNDSLIVGATNQVFNPQQNGTYAVIMTKGACADTSNCFTVSGIGLVEDDATFKFKLYPNPAQGFITIESSSSGEYEIFSSDGRSCIKGEFNQASASVNLAGLVPGVYAITLKTRDCIVTKKIILQRAE
jgi:uncharacterized delta-60 repeat protein